MKLVYHFLKFHLPFYEVSGLIVFPYFEVSVSSVHSFSLTIFLSSELCAILTISSSKLFTGLNNIFLLTVYRFHKSALCDNIQNAQSVIDVANKSPYIPSSDV